MKRHQLGCLFALGLVAGANAPAATRYVDLNSGNPAAPYNSWATAAANIQDAVEVAEAGDQILVTNGTYQSGGKTVATAGTTTTNRVAVTKSLALQSVNGPEFTMIKGDLGVRCVYLTDGASLSGFTLRNGFVVTQEPLPGGGGLFCPSQSGLVTNCVIVSNTVSGELDLGGRGGNGGGAQGGTLNNCQLIGNGATDLGGGAYGSVLVNCVVSSNRGAFRGGGIYGGTLNDCTLAGNSSFADGGGAYNSVLTNCVLVGNQANHGNGGGVYRGILKNCMLIGNLASGNGGAAYGSSPPNPNLLVLYNCRLSGNWAGSAGGGAYAGTLNNCTLTDNTANYYGGGASYSWLNNCTVISNRVNYGGGGGTYNPKLKNSIVHFNTAPNGPNYVAAFSEYSCTTPMPTNGVGNITNAPLFVDQTAGNLRQSNSPCINAGHNAHASGGTDLDGNPRIKGGTVDMGAYEYQSPASMLSYSWAQQYGLPTDGSQDYADADADGHNAWQEWRADTNPTNASSVLRLLAPTGSLAGVTVRWQSVSTRHYFLERSTDIGSQPVFFLFETNIAGFAGETSVTDTGVAGPGPFFYRVGVQP